MPADTRLEIRAVSERDSYDDLTTLLHRAYAALRELGFNYTAVDQTVETTRQRAAGGECYIGLIDERIVATLVLQPPVSQPTSCVWYNHPGIWVIGQFAVSPELQGRGFGTQMLEFAERRAVQLGALETSVDTAEGAQQLLDYYAKRGYRQVDLAKWEGKNYRSLVLSKALARGGEPAGD